MAPSSGRRRPATIRDDPEETPEARAPPRRHHDEEPMATSPRPRITALPAGLGSCAPSEGFRSEAVHVVGGRNGGAR